MAGAPASLAREEASCQGANTCGIGGAARRARQAPRLPCPGGSLLLPTAPNSRWGRKLEQAAGAGSWGRRLGQAAGAGGCWGGQGGELTCSTSCSPSLFSSVQLPPQLRLMVGWMTRTDFCTGNRVLLMRIGRCRELGLEQPLLSLSRLHKFPDPTEPRWGASSTTVPTQPQPHIPRAHPPAHRPTHPRAYHPATYLHTRPHTVPETRTLTASGVRGFSRKEGSRHSSAGPCWAGSSAKRSGCQT